MQCKREIIAFLREHIEELVPDVSYESHLPCIDWEITPRDFLDFAESELEGELTDQKLVNATSNLKRAVDCQIDFLLSRFNLDRFYRVKRLGIDKKLGFLSQAGIFRTKSIRNLNIVRNRLEHHYEIPELTDINVYFDLVSAFISIVERVLPLVGPELQFKMRLEDSGGGISIELETEAPSISIELENQSTDYVQRFKCEVFEDSAIGKLEEFSFLFRVLVLLRDFSYGVSGKEHVLKHLDG